MLRRVQCAILWGTKWKEGKRNWACGVIGDRREGKGKEVEWGEGEEGEGTNSPSLDSEGGEGGGANNSSRSRVGPSSLREEGNKQVDALGERN